MNQLFALTRVNLAAIVSQFMSAFNTKKKGGKLRGAAFIALLLFIIVSLVFSAGSTFWAVAMQTEPDGMWIIAAMAFLSSATLSLVLGFYTAVGVLFTGKDLELLFSYPLRQWQILAAKLAAIYIENATLSAVICVPGAFVYGIYAPPVSAASIACWAAGMILIPLIPMAAGIVVSYLVHVLTSGSRLKHLFTIVISFVLVFGYIYTLQPGMETKILLGAQSPGDVVRVFPPLGWITRAVVTPNFADIALFILISAAVFAAAVIPLSLFYRRMWLRATAVRARSGAEVKAKVSGQFAALLRKEAGRYFSSPVYVMNTFVGMVMMCILTCFMCFNTGAELTEFLNAPEVAGLIAPGIILILSATAGMSNTAASSITIEGTGIGMTKSFPVAAMTLYKAKLGLNALVVMPLTLINAVVLSAVLGVGLFGFLWMSAIPLLFTAVSILSGLIFNLHIHRFDFVNDTQAVKNNPSVLLSILVTFGGAAVAGVGYAFAAKVMSFDVFAALVCAVLALAAFALWRYLAVNGERLYAEL